MIEVRNVTRTYGKKGSAFQALRGISFQIPTGATAAIVGKSGSGKSTLMHLMGGLDRPTSGEILINGKSLGSLRRRAIDRFRSRDLGFVFQSFFIEANQTCYQNVALPLEINDVPLRRRRAMVDQALEQVELFDKVKAKAATLSGGQKQRLAIARAIVHKPRILLADEPTGNLDSVTGDKVINLLFDLNRRLQCTLIIVTHDAELAARCQYQIVVRDGKVVSMRVPAKAAAQAQASAGQRPPVRAPQPSLPSQPAQLRPPQPQPVVSSRPLPPQQSQPPVAVKPATALTTPKPAVTVPPKPTSSRRIIQ